MTRGMMCLALACLVGVPVPAASAGIFPALRKRLESQREAVLVQNATEAAPAQPVEVEVPAPVDVGADGFPVLPGVDQMLGGATRTLKTVNSQATDIVGRMAYAQKQSVAELGRQKRAFEDQLKSQETNSLAVAQSNIKIVAETDSLKAGNNGLRKQAHKIQKKIAVLRSLVHSLEMKMNVAKDFDHTTMVETDDSKQAALKVFGGHKGPDDDFLRDDRPVPEDEDDEEDEKASQQGTSFLAIFSVATKTHGSAADASETDLDMALPMGLMQQASLESPDAILTELTKDVRILAQQRKQGVDKLKNLFIRDYRAGARRHLALVSEQKVLNTQMEAQKTLQRKLKVAVAHLQGTHTQLGRRLHGLGQFLQKLAHVANAPEPEVANLLDNLPSAPKVAPAPRVAI